jgi:murein DD-endopeptidase MepM/ murein hydrolase activator NlpD
VVANLRYAKSGHKMRVAHVEKRRAQTVSTPEAKKRLALFFGVLAVPIVAAGIAAKLPRAPRAPASAVAEVSAMPAPVAPAVLAPAVVQPAPQAPPPPADPWTHAKLAKDEALSSALARIGVDAEDRNALVRALKDHLETRSLREGAPLKVELAPTGALLAFEIGALTNAGVPRTVRALREPDPITVETPAPTFKVKHEDAPIETEIAALTGTVRSSLYQAMVDAGEDPVLVDKFVDVFAWNVDFYRQTQRGDTYKVLVEKRRAGGRFLGYGRVVAAEYDNAGSVHRGFLFQSKDGKHDGTYDEEGNALMRTFLKNPMEIARITSSYGMRFHPVLGRNKAHQGVDYGAPTGTPVWSVADGVVTEARYSKSAGNMILVKHINGFETQYFHLSRFADSIRPGARIKQKQVIGYVGSTGMSTGPHLHFGLLKGGGHVDPQKQKFPNAKPVPKEYRGELEDFVRPLLAELQSLGRA